MHIDFKMGGSSAKSILVIVAMILIIPKGEGQIIATPFSCYKAANSIPGCMNAFTQTIFYNNATNLTPDCCKIVNGINKICSLFLFPTHPEAIIVLKAICSFVNSHPPPAPAATPPPPSSASSTPPPSTSSPPPSPPSGSKAPPSPPSASSTPSTPPPSPPSSSSPPPPQSSGSSTPPPSTSTAPSPPTGASPPHASPPASAPASPPSNH
ncbi:classical arabinogalactan protein 9-like [Euphorbia lathyris]|uniref:classical arabinogalactan protein 9-like n=1 Tax=Euphorbia lathyris TaxID=212925 RepID=UPI00331394ED